MNSRPADPSEVDPARADPTVSALSQAGGVPASATGLQLRLRGVTKTFGDGPPAVDAIDLDVAANEFVVLVGPSGCGKSTTLRLVAGLEPVTAGTIRIGDADVTALGAADRDVAMVFQSYALYPHMTVAQNIGFGLRRRGVPRAEVARAVAEAARVLEITDLLHRRPGALSGGQRQRVAMGRAIVRRPRLFMFDEPLSNLDARLRMAMRTEIRRLHALAPTTTLYVTHDQTEAMTMADRVVVMNAGRIAQIGTPMEIYARPASDFVAGFFGAPAMNMARGDLADGMLSLPGGVRLPLPGLAHRGATTLGLRPEALRIDPEGPIPARLELVEPLGAETLGLWQTQALGAVWLRHDPGLALQPGLQARLAPDMTRAHPFDPATGLRLAASL